MHVNKSLDLPQPQPQLRQFDKPR